jgi:hypothetical protein
MKRNGFVLSMVILIGFFYGCASTGPYKPLDQAEMEDIKIIGQIQCNFYSMTYLGAGRISKSNQEQAYIELLKEANKLYQENIDIRNVTVSYVGINIEHGNEFTASGTVIINNSGGNIGINGALNQAIEKIIKQLPEGSTIAVLNISSQNNENVALLMDELEFKLVDSRHFKVVDRKTLDQIRNEQNFQMSGEVDDNSAVSIGKLLGANIVITGSINDVGSIKTITLKALNVMTAEIVSMAREQY